jgi:hypothetical protein
VAPLRGHRSTAAGWSCATTRPACAPAPRRESAASRPELPALRSARCLSGRAPRPTFAAGGVRWKALFVPAGSIEPTQCGIGLLAADEPEGRERVPLHRGESGAQDCSGRTNLVRVLSLAVYIHTELALSPSRTSETIRCATSSSTSRGACVMHTKPGRSSESRTP